MAGICRKRRIIPFIIGGYVDHVHLILSYHPAISVSNFVKELKTASNAFMKYHLGRYPEFACWQIGYGAFSYDMSAKNNLIQYVKNQATHHSKVSYRDELIGLLNEFGVDYDEKYLFD